jgi:tetratricopeptide (TPR) repeat protein
MPSENNKKFLKNINRIIFIFLLLFLNNACAQETDSSPAPLNNSKVNNIGVSRENILSGSGDQEAGLTQFQKEARNYRDQGYKLQSEGDLERALGLYQKAIELDPGYAVVYNDLGVLYETKGLSDKSEELYLRAISMDPYYLSAYSNLAFLYENKGDFGQASYYWSKRVDLARELGLESDPWTEKAKQRLEIDSAASGSNNEFQLISFMKDVARKKVSMVRDERELAKSYFGEAKESYIKNDYTTAIKKGIDARQLDPENSDIDDFIEKAQLRALSR